MLQGIPEMVNAESFQSFAIVFSTPEKFLVELSGPLGTLCSATP